MPLTGELEHLPIVDVIQLINTTRKSGTLYVYSRKGEGQLVFDQGYIVGASHSNEKFRIGQILLDAKIISEADLDKALAAQKSAGENRKPLIATLLEHCGISKEVAFKALETLIEMTVVEMISWARGIFSLDVDSINVTDDYRYLPEQLQQEVTFDSQMILLDALRIYDEKVHAGEISIVDEPLTEPPAAPEETTDQQDREEVPELVLSDEMLGLADLDKIERKKPRCFETLNAFDPTDIHRQIISKNLPGLGTESQGQLIHYLSELSSPRLADEMTLKAATQSQAVIMYASDEFLQHAVMTVCKREGIMVFTTSDRQDLGILLEKALQKHLQPLLIFDKPDSSSETFNATKLRTTRQQIRAEFPQASIIQLVSADEYVFSLQSLGDGVRTVFPRPGYDDHQTSYAENAIEFLRALQAYIQGCFNQERQQQFAQLRDALAELKGIKFAPEISLAVLRFVAQFFDRSLTLVVSKNDFIAERSIGLQADKLSGPSPPLQFRFQRLADSLLDRACSNREIFFGANDDQQLTDNLLAEIGLPRENQILLLPLVGNDRVVTITYADFGARPAARIPIDYLDFFAQQASLTIENALYRKQLDKTSSEK